MLKLNNIDLIFLLSIIPFFIISCEKVQQGEVEWEYEEISQYGVTNGEYGTPEFQSPIHTLNKLGKEGWELVGVCEIIGTRYPNFGDNRFVMGIKSDTYTSCVKYILKRRIKQDREGRKGEDQKGLNAFERLKAKDSTIIKTQSGLYYKVVSAGVGDSVGQRGKAKIKYKGTFLDGTKFDENQTGTITRPVMLIPGFGEALSKMRKGSRYILYIPSELAYGAEGSPDGTIAGGDSLIFDVTVLDVNIK